MHLQLILIFLLNWLLDVLWTAFHEVSTQLSGFNRTTKEEFTLIFSLSFVFDGEYLEILRFHPILHKLHLQPKGISLAFHHQIQEFHFSHNVTIIVIIPDNDCFTGFLHFLVGFRFLLSSSHIPNEFLSSLVHELAYLIER